MFVFQIFHNSPELIRSIFACTVESTVLGKTSEISLNYFWTNSLHSVRASECASKYIKGCFHSAFFVHSFALFSETKSCISDIDLKTWAHRTEWVTWLPEQISMILTWTRKFLSQGSAQELGSINKHWEWFTSPYNRFFLKKSLLIFFFYTPFLGKGEQQEVEEFEEKKEMACSLPWWLKW